MADTILALAAGRRGHFAMESGYHAASWFELDSLFDRPRELRPFVSELARRVSSYGIDAVCGPMIGGARLAQLIAGELGIESFEAARFETAAEGLFPIRYELSAEQRRRARERTFAIVDDAISAGSAVRGTYADLIACGARPVALGALMVFGDGAQGFAEDKGLTLEAIERLPFEMWLPDECPLCRAGVRLDPVRAG